MRDPGAATPCGHGLKGVAGPTTVSMGAVSVGVSLREVPTVTGLVAAAGLLRAWVSDILRCSWASGQQVYD